MDHGGAHVRVQQRLMLRQGLRAVWEAQKSCEPVLRSGTSCGTAVYTTRTLEGHYRHELIDPDAGMTRWSRSIFLNDAIAACDL
jgi:hypothetical protein